MFYSEDVIEDVRRHNDIVDVIGKYVSLKHNGNNRYVGLCPFHSEKTGSFSVSTSTQLYHCFGCHKGGNVITFVMEYENMTFPEALKMLAERGGVKLPEAKYSPEEQSKAVRAQILKDIYKKAAIWYYNNLRKPDGARGMEYLKGRGLSDAIIHNFGLGYSPKNSGSLYEYLKGEGYTDENLKDSALFSFSEAYGMRDKFWNRVMFPIMDQNGKVVAFGGRVMGEGEPKYLNSNETLIFDKSRTLYAYNIARRTKSNFLLLCEGYMDVISLHQAGFDNAVASLGTAFTAGHAELIAKLKKRVIITYDSDKAGRAAALRAIPILKAAGITTKVLNMDPYKDPDEFVKALGREEYEKRIRDAIPGFIYEVRCVENDYDLGNPEEKTKFFDWIADRLLGFRERIERNNYCETIAKLYGVSLSDFTELVNNKAASKSSYEESAPASAKPDYEKKKEGNSLNNECFLRERLLLTWSMEDGRYGKVLMEFLTPESFQEGIPRSVAVLSFNQMRDNMGKIMPASIINHFETPADQGIASDLFQAEIWDQMAGDRKSIDKGFTEALCKCAECDLERQLKEVGEKNDIETFMKLTNRKKDIKKLSAKVMEMLAAEK